MIYQYYVIGRFFFVNISAQYSSLGHFMGSFQSIDEDSTCNKNQFGGSFVTIKQVLSIF